MSFIPAVSLLVNVAVFTWREVPSDPEDAITAIRELGAKILDFIGELFDICNCELAF